MKKTLSVFVDESGDFGAYEKHSPNYIVTMVFHNQSIDISYNIRVLNTLLLDYGYKNHAVHVGPLIRREADYQNYTREERKQIFNALFHFVRKLDISYSSVVIKKQLGFSVIDMTVQLSKALVESLRSNIEFLNNYDKIIIYYDNGQIELTKILVSVFNALFTNVEHRKVRPVEYKLFQAADLLFTMELLSEKLKENGFSKSEHDFFGCGRDYKKNYYKPLSGKRI